MPIKCNNSLRASEWYYYCMHPILCRFTYNCQEDWSRSVEKTALQLLQNSYLIHICSQSWPDLKSYTNQIYQFYDSCKGCLRKSAQSKFQVKGRYVSLSFKYFMFCYVPSKITTELSVDLFVNLLPINSSYQQTLSLIITEQTSRYICNEFEKTLCQKS